MRFFASSAVCAGLLAVASGALVFSPAQEKPLTRTFLDGSVETFQVEVSMQVDVRGVSTQSIGEKTYVTPTAHHAQVVLRWKASRRIVSVAGDGTAQIEETDTPYSAQCEGGSGADPDAQKLQQSLAEICSHLRAEQTLRYEERPDGLILDLPKDPALALDENPPLLTLWLRRNLRPSVILPALPFQPGARSQRPIRSSGMNGSETTEWVDSATGTSGATLHVLQELSWPEPAIKSDFSNVGGQPPGKTTFFADSNTVVSIEDGGVTNSTRTASRETKRILNPVEGLAQAPEFSSKLAVVITVRRIS